MAYDLSAQGAKEPVVQTAAASVFVRTIVRNVQKPQDTWNLNVSSRAVAGLLQIRSLCTPWVWSSWRGGQRIRRFNLQSPPPSNFSDAHVPAPKTRVLEPILQQWWLLRRGTLREQTPSKYANLQPGTFSQVMEDIN